MKVKKILGVKKFISLALVSTIVFPMFTMNASANNKGINSTHEIISQNSDTGVIKNQQALTLYNKLISKNTRSKIMSSTRNMENKFTGDFDALNYVGNKDSNIDIIYNEGDEITQSVIVFNKDTNIYSFLEVSLDSNDLIYIVDNQKYKLSYEGENINLYSENGAVLPILITEYEDTPFIKQDLNSLVESETKISYGKEYGPFKKTNKTIVDVLGAAATIGGVAALKIKHPVLGIVSTVAGAVSWVGNVSYATLYIKYYQSYATNGSSKVRQRDRYYRYNNYTSFVKERIWTFNSSRP